MSLSRIRCLVSGTAALLLGSVPLAAQGIPSRQVEVAVLAIEVGASTDAEVNRLAEQCVARLIEALRARKVAVRRGEPSDAKPARLTVQGSLTGEGDSYTAELRLLDGQTGDELRSYLYGPGDAKGVLGLADRAAPRIAAVVDELRAAER